MATDQVLSWMQNDLKLSTTVNSFETDFANGYLFGEILVQYGVYENIKEFSKKQNKEAKVNNFYLIEDALRYLGVRFDAKLIHNIMQEERGAALRLLYQLKLACQKLQGAEATELEEMTLTGLKHGFVEKRLSQKKEKTQSLAGTITYKTEGGKDVRTSKTKRMDRHLVKYQVAKQELFDKVNEAKRAEMTLIQKITQDQRADNRQKLQENQIFMKEWEAEGRQNWRQNQKIRSQNIAKVKYFEDREVNIYKNKLMKELNEATREMTGGISEFEKNLQKLGIEQNVNMEDAIKRMDEKKGIPPGQIQNFSYAATMNKIKETKKNTDFAGKERDRRRRKLMVDQATTQERLDKEKNEDQLLEKLLKRQTEEQKQAYVDQRNALCKALVFENRRQKAEAIAQRRKEETDILEKKRVEETKAGEASRQKQIQKSRADYAALRKTQKAQKRALNIEIASEVFDLILDLSDEVFEVQNQTGSKKISKQQWREFTGIFKSGKRVSLRNVVKKQTSGIADELAQNMLHFSKKQTVNGLLNEFDSEPSLHDFLEFLSVSGSFNLAQIKPDEWDSNKEIVAKYIGEGAKIHDQYQPNTSIGVVLKQLYDKIQDDNPIFEEDQEADTEGIAPVRSIPNNLCLKLAILGRAFSGKKTLAKELTQKFNLNDVKLFSMDELIKEALDYISPKKVDEAAQQDNRSKPKKGNKHEDLPPADPFEGKDTVAYKEVANEIKTKFFPDYEGELSQKIDLVNLVSNDELLVNLFVEKLKLTFDQSEDEDTELRNKVKREKEIKEQLKDLESNAANAAADPKSKKGAPKGKPQEEVLHEELEKLQQVKKNGWILLDFPRTLTQIKLLERSLSGYTSPQDVMKEESQENFESWSKVVTPDELFGDFQNKINAHSSGFDGIVFLETPAEECVRRATGRQIDPQTNVIYHPDSNPVPEDSKDSKLKERLQDYTDDSGDSSRLTANHARFAKTIEPIKQWTSNFGLVDPENKKCEVKLDIVIEQDLNSWQDKQKVVDAVSSHIKKILAFKQRIVDAKREKINEELEAEKSQADNKSENKEEESSERSKAGVHVEVDNTLAKDNSRKVLSSQGHISQSQGDRSSKSFMRSTKALTRVFEVSDSQKYKRFTDFLCNYYKEGMQWFNMMRLQRQRVFKALNDTQSQFIAFLSRQSTHQKKINDFCESFNRFTEEYPELRENDQTKEELLGRVDILSKQLWQTIQQRKNEALDERKRLMDGGWASVEMANLCEYVSKLIENEFNRFNAIQTLFSCHVLNDDIDLAGFCKRLSEKGTEPIERHEDSFSTSPLLNEVINQVIAQIRNLMNEPFVASLDQEKLNILEKEQQNFYMRLNLVQVWAILLLEEVSLYSNQVFDELDEWVVTAVKKENQSCQFVVKEIRKEVQNDTKYLESLLIEDIDLFGEIETIQFSEGPPFYMQVEHEFAQLTDRRFSIQTLELLYKQFRYHSSSTNLLDSKTFTTLIVLNMQSDVLPKQWLTLTFNKIFKLTELFKTHPLTDEGERVESKPLFQQTEKEARVYIDWKQLFTAFVLIHSEIPSKDDLSTFVKKLEEVADPQTGLVGERFLQVEAWFDQIEGSFEPAPVVCQVSASNSDGTVTAQATTIGEIEDSDSLDEDRLAAVKKLIFDTHCRPNQNGVRIKDVRDTFEKLQEIGKGEQISFYQAFFN